MQNAKRTNYLDGVAFGRSQHIAHVIEVAFSNITADPEQPRKHFDPDELNSLSESIKRNGLLQPITVRRDISADGKYIIVAGERRFRASQLAGLPSIACIVTEADPKELALIENIQRTDLNPIEEAVAVDALIKQHRYTHEAVAQVLGKNRSYISETLKFLELPEATKQKLITTNVKWSVLRHISQMDDEGRAEALAKIEGGEGLTVSEAKYIRERKAMTPAKLAKKAIDAATERLKAMEGKPKSDEMKVLREAKKAFDLTFSILVKGE